MSELKERQVYNICDPLLDAGKEFTITVNQSLKEGTSERLNLTGSSAVKIRVEGPQTKIDPTFISGVYPAPGSEETPDEYLPHVALNRRTLPWERPGPAAGAPWMALLLVKASEMQSTWRRFSRPYGISPLVAQRRGIQAPSTEVLRDPEINRPGKVAAPSVVVSPPAGGPIVVGPVTPIPNIPIAASGSLEDTTVAAIKTRDERTWQQLRNVVKLSDSAQIFAAFIPNKVLAAILPAALELEKLAHMKRTWVKGVEQDTSLVVCNRLPDAGDGSKPVEEHTALLVSLEGRADLYESGRLSDHSKATALVVLHHWSFKPSGDGDFEELMHAIALRPNGGVLRFGNLPKDAAGRGSLSGGFASMLDNDGYFPDHLQHEQVDEVSFRGPFRPFPPSPRASGFAVRAQPEEFTDTPGVHDYSHAAAFELGRLLGLADSSILQDMREIGTTPDRLPAKEWVNQLPPVLQKPDWVQNDDWFEQPWEMPGKQLLRNELQHQAQFGMADVTGFEHKGMAWKNNAIESLKNAPATPVIEVIDVAFEAIDINVLEEILVDVVVVAQP